MWALHAVWRSGPLGAPILGAIGGVEVEPHADAVLGAPLERQIGVLETAFHERRGVRLRRNAGRSGQ